MSSFINRSNQHHDIILIKQNCKGDINSLYSSNHKISINGSFSTNSIIHNSTIYYFDNNVDDLWMHGYYVVPNIIKILNSVINIRMIITDNINYNISNSIITTKTVDITDIKSINYYMTNFYDEDEDYFAKYYKQILQKLK